MYFATVDLAGISFFRETHLPLTHRLEAPPSRTQSRCTFPNQLEAPLRLMRKIFWDLYILLAKKDVSPYIMATCWNFFNIFWDFHKKMQKVDVIHFFPRVLRWRWKSYTLSFYLGVWLSHDIGIPIVQPTVTAVTESPYKTISKAASPAIVDSQSMASEITLTHSLKSLPTLLVNGWLVVMQLCWCWRT